eukprot:jgi/Botrbrau1/242/Bobra.0022s0217.1
MALSNQKLCFKPVGAGGLCCYPARWPGSLNLVTPRRSLHQISYNTDKLNRNSRSLCSCTVVLSSARAKGASSSERRRSSGQDLAKLPAKLFVRAVAVHQLTAIEVEGAYIGVIKRKQTQGEGQMSERDARFVTQLVYGATRWRRKIDCIIQTVAKRDPSKIKPPELLQILRLGIYEVLELGLADHVINEFVDLAKVLVRPDAGRFANGVLRQIVLMRQNGQFPFSPSEAYVGEPGGQADALAITHSHPTWMVQQWLDQFGEDDTIRLLSWNNRHPCYSVRVNTAMVSVEEFCKALEDVGCKALPSNYLASEFVSVQSGLQQLLKAGFHKSGKCQVQDESAGLVVAVLDPQPGETILDACAAPGGKALFAASRMRGQGKLVAMDVNAARLKALPATAQTQGLSGCVQVECGDLRQTAHAEDGQADVPPYIPECGFDRVLLDVPCSGLGVLSKRSDLRWRRTPEDIEGLVQLQAELLDAAATLVKPGGLLVYSTCSILPSENAQAVEAFLVRNSKFIGERVPKGLVPESVLTADGHMATLPHVHEVDGAFAARLRRRS